jgi:hypothetical protein
VGNNPAVFSGEPAFPIETVSWQEATNYCALLTVRERTAGRIPSTWRYRLPTEAEWEYAARAGTDTRFAHGDDELNSLLGEYSWYVDTAVQMPVAVEQLKPNRWGLFDMTGNVAEWCWDVFGDYAGGQIVDPTGPAIGQYRVARGGSWNDPSERCRSAARASYLAVGSPYRSAQIGFRVALAPVYAQPQPVVEAGTLKGTVKGKITMQVGGAPAPGVQVTLVNTNAMPDTNSLQLNREAFAQVAITDQEGNYFFSNVKPGGYAVSPFRSDSSSTLFFHQDNTSEPAQLAITNDAHEVNFIVDDPSLHEGLGEVTLNLRVVNAPPGTSFTAWSYRRCWAFFIPYLLPIGCFDWNDPDVQSGYFPSVYGYTALFASMDNYWSIDIYQWDPGFVRRYLCTRVVYFPLGGCPSSPKFEFDYRTYGFRQVP